MTEQQRRRLTVSACDPVVEAARKGKSGPSKIEQVVQEYYDKLGQGRNCVLLHTKIDDQRNKKQSFADKDQLIYVAGGGLDDSKVEEWLKQRGIHYRCKKGLKPESPNQDAFALVVVEGDFALYGVLDGHGPYGHDASHQAQDHLIEQFLRCRMATPPASAEDAFLAAFKSTQEMLRDDKNVDFNTSGATCTQVFHSFKESYILVAHVGDSRSIMLTADGDVKDLTVDHKPNLPEEKARIESSKPPGRVVFDGYFNHRVFSLKGMYPGLNMSRALGDLLGHREAGISAVPDLKRVDLKPGKNEPILMVCSDGVWEFLESAAAMATFRAKDDGSEGVEDLAKKSWNAWMDDSDNEVSDDITAVVVMLTTAAGGH